MNEQRSTVRRIPAVCFGEYDPSSMECQRCAVKEACAVDAWFKGEEGGEGD